MKKFILLFLLIVIFLLLSCYSYVNSVSTNLSSSVIRLHVIANSNSVSDQELKYMVRDSLIDYMNSININSQSKEESEQIIKSHLDDFNRITQNTIVNNGFSYDSKVEYVNDFFPTKVYSSVSFPSGYYDALRVIIGNGSGQNWWCVMFPPLCFVNTESYTLSDESLDYLKKSLSEEDYDLINQNSSSYEIKFKIVELFNSFSMKNNFFDFVK